MIEHKRSDWTTTPLPRSRLSLMVPSRVKGFAVHWPGSTKALGNPDDDSIARRLEDYRAYHVDDRGWSDIAYQVAFDQRGGVWPLRTPQYRSAANGDSGPNTEYGAILLLLGPGDEPTPALVDAVRQWRREVWLALYPNATLVRRHGDVRPHPTACPGNAAGALVRAGAFLLPPSKTPAAAPAPTASAPPPVAPAPKDDDVKIWKTEASLAQYLVGTERVFIPGSPGGKILGEMQKSFGETIIVSPETMAAVPLRREPYIARDERDGSLWVVDGIWRFHIPTYADYERLRGTYGLYREVDEAALDVLPVATSLALLATPTAPSATDKI